jgi:hypothetical protein
MEKKSKYNCLDGRKYDVTMSWNEKFKDADQVFKIGFQAINHDTNKPLALPREIATYAIGSPEETLGERVQYYYGGNRENMMSEYLTTAYRRACDWIERGK